MAEKLEDVDSVQETAQCSEAMSELEAVCEDEFELFLHQKHDCRKKDRHGEFIPIQEFSIDNLDPPYKDQTIVDVVKQMAALTVRLTVREISSLRPPYPYPPEKRVSENDSRCLLSGSGFVNAASAYKEESGNLCPCSECKASDSPRTSWGNVHIITARHVVFDSFEAEKTTCYFDFDEDDTDIAGIPSLTCSKAFPPIISVTSDSIHLFCYTHDVDFAEKLRNMTHICYLSRAILTKTYYGSSDTQALDPSYLHKVIDYFLSIIATIEITKMNCEYIDHLVGVLNTLVSQVYTISNIVNEESTTKMIHQCLDQSLCYLNTVVQQNFPTLPSILQPKGNLVIVVSHPHGCGKYVSLGVYTSRQEVPDDFGTNEFLREIPAAFYTYTAHTCPGSSGGPVFILSKENVGRAITQIHSMFLTKRNLSRCSLRAC
ncbi:hypothetical protein BsWGS_25140 [Bradybaena similaris]